MKRKICVVTGTRAEYGLLYWIIKSIHEDPKLELQLVVTGMHLVPEFGLTVREIERDGFPIAERLDLRLVSDTPAGIATSMGVGVMGFARAYNRVKPDILLVLGDRFEILSAAAAAIPFRLPIAHIHGGETSEGVIDEAIRHAITKMSHIHFTSTELYRKRVVQMGEAPERVFCVGAPGLDNIHKCRILSRKRLFEVLHIPRYTRIGIATYHPVTLDRNSAGRHIGIVLEAIKSTSGLYWIFSLPNADTDRKVIAEKIKDFFARYPQKGKVVASLGRIAYPSMLRYAEVMIGNSSSGLIEAPSFGLPVVNIGDRQAGRLRAENVIDVSSYSRDLIARALRKALSGRFRSSLHGMKNPYEGKDTDTSKRIVHVLKTIRLGESLIKKRFYDL